MKDPNIENPDFCNLFDKKVKITTDDKVVIGILDLYECAGDNESGKETLTILLRDENRNRSWVEVYTPDIVSFEVLDDE